MRRLILALALLPLPALAQTDDRSYLTALLEDNLSGAGRQVVITGFEGALSSTAHLDQLTIADDQGVWLTLTDVSLDWNRTALFSGNVSVNELTAASITLARLPQSQSTIPAPEAGEFALPELPVSVQIGRLAADQITLGPDVLGQPVQGRFAASLSLAGGEGAADLRLERLDDGPDGLITLTTSYSNLNRALALDLSAVEGAGGLAATALDLPGKPAASLTISGKGPFSDFAAQVNLATDGTDRLAGTVSVKAESDSTTGFLVDLSGDLAPLFLPEFAEFFGNRIALKASGQAHADGRLDLADLNLNAKAISLTGRLSLAANGEPRSFDLTGRIAQADGTPVLLPLTTDLPLRVQSADIALAYDRARGEGWTGRAAISGFDRADFRASQLTLAGSGRIAPAQFGATLRFDAEGLQPTDTALSRALGSVVSGDATLFWTKASRELAIPRLRLAGEDYAANLHGIKIKGLSDALAITGTGTASLDDLSRLSDLAGRPLSGAAKLSLTGQAQPLTGAFDMNLTAKGTDMALGLPEVDNLLRGPATLQASILRDTKGTQLRELTVQANSLTATAQGRLQSAGADLTAQFDFTDLSVLGRGYGGALSGDGQFTGSLASGQASINGRGRNLRMGQAEADRLLAGESKVQARASLKDGALRLDALTLGNPQLTASATGQLDGQSQTLDVTARLQNLALLLPEFPGALTVKGTVAQSATGTRLDLTGQGPGGIDARVAGTLSPAFDTAQLAITGRAQAALGNAFLAPRAVSGDLGFDLALNGPLALRSLTGSVTVDQGKLTDPALTFLLQGIRLRADLAGGVAKLNGNLPVSTGGVVAIAGTIGLTEPFSAALGLGLQSVALRDPDLYETTISGDVTITGPLTGGAMIAGALDLGETELRVPSTGFGGAGGLPDLRHINEPAPVRATRARAGLLATAQNGAANNGPAFGLDLTISAPKRLFIRGRGLDAELGGALRLTGTTLDVRPVGAFDLIRGRLDILGKRLDLDEATLQMEGDLLPFVRVSASTESDGITVTVLIEGPANDPKVSFLSSPELPEEEVLAQLLFGQGLQNLSALQALQLANAVATLAGKGGEGVVNRLRQGFGLDNLDVKTTTDGGTEITAGKYITEKVYTEVTVDQNGNSQIDLNFDVTKSITLRAGANSDGSTGAGVYLEKDY